MLTLIEAVVFTIILILTVYGFFSPLYLRYRLIRLGKPENRFDHPVKRLKDAIFSFFFLQCSVKKERVITGLVHSFILFGALIFDSVSILHIIEGFVKGAHIAPIHILLADIFGVLVLLAVLYFMGRRYILRPKSYTSPSLESAIIYTLLITVTITFFLYEGSIIAHNPDSEQLAFVGKWVSGWIPSSEMAVKFFWWIHILNVFIFVVYVPRSKYLHMIFGPVNIAFQDYRPPARITPLDIENSEVFGVKTYSDLTWRDLFDGFACIDCGRCSDYCPAFKTEKPLSPKDIIWKLRNDLLKKGPVKLKDKNKTLEPLMTSIYTGDEIWACTTCGACMHVCPVKNEHVPKIVGLRQSEVLMDAKFPSELTSFFKNMETNSNPWGFGSATRGEWASDLNLKTLAEESDVEYLYYVGCAGSFDDRGKKVSTALIKILQAANISFGILGNEENCCGDQARRLGHEYMFQMMAQENISVFQKYNIKKILVTCPHGFNTFKNEYPEMARMLGKENWSVEVVHHSQLIKGLIKQGRIKLEPKIKSTLTYHDPCYLGRHNSIFKEPRDILKQAGDNFIEIKDNTNHSMCCGGGGGLMWTDETLGTRIYLMRTEEALKTKPGIVSTACPFCMTMFEDGIKDLNKEEECKVKDIAEIVAQCLVNENQL